MNKTMEEIRETIRKQLQKDMKTFLIKVVAITFICFGIGLLICWILMR